MKNKVKNSGFTFIEVLVVTTIIAVLTAVGVTNFGVANKKSRDGKRKGDLEQIRAALELYYTDENQYPITSAVTSGSPLTSASETYMEVVPSDPTSAQNYSYTGSGTTYTLCAALEIGGSTVSGCGSCGATCNYKVVNPL